MIFFPSRILRNNLIRSILLYTGFVSLVLTWPVANMVLQNDSFRIVGNWSQSAFLLFVILYFVIPTFFLVFLEYLLKKKRAGYTLILRHILFYGGAIIIWVQFLNHNLAFANSSGFWGISAGALFSIVIIYLLRKYVTLFLMYISPLVIITLVLLFFQTLHSTPFNRFFNAQSVHTTSRLTRPVYVLIFDGFSLSRILDNEKINEKFFPTFSHLSEEWTWYRNATTSATSTVPARPMIFSGQYYKKDRDAIMQYNNNLFQTIAPYLNIYASLGPEFREENRESSPRWNIFSKRDMQNAIKLQKALFAAYISVSTPSPPQKTIPSQFLENWKFDWRAPVPEDYKDRPTTYHGMRMKDQFFTFLEESTDPTHARGKLLVLWSIISHYPYIFDARGNTHERKYNTFEPNMDKPEIEKTTENYLQVLQYTDYLIGTFIEGLKKAGLYEESIILITSDHGISETGITHNISDRVTRIPFFIKAPNLPSGPNDRDVQHIDITPTLLDILGIPLSPEYDGQSLLRPYQKRDKVMYTVGGSGVFIMQEDGTWPYIE